MLQLLVLLGLVGVGLCQSGSGFSGECGNMNLTGNNQSNAEQRFCAADAFRVRREEHFYCRGYINASGQIDPNTEAAPDPSTGDVWSIFLQYPALAYMDIARKKSLFLVLEQVINLGCNDMVDHTRFCVSNATLYGVTDYKESVLITIYNFGINAETVEGCFQMGLGVANYTFVRRFRGRRAFVIDLDVGLEESFTQNIHPGSSISNPDRDPMRRAIYLRSRGDRVYYSVNEAADGVSFASNPRPINYGLEAGDIVFAVFGSILLVIVGGLIVLGFFIHPFFLS